MRVFPDEFDPENDANHEERNKGRTSQIA